MFSRAVLPINYRSSTNIQSLGCLSICHFNLILSEESSRFNVISQTCKNKDPRGTAVTRYDKTFSLMNWHIVTGILVHIKIEYYEAFSEEYICMDLWRFIFNLSLHRSKISTSSVLASPPIYRRNYFRHNGTSLTAIVVYMWIHVLFSNLSAMQDDHLCFCV